MKDRDISLLTRGLAPVLRDYVLAALMPLAQRIAELEKREPLRGEKGDAGEKGLTGERGEVGPQGLTGEKGERGEKGEKGDAGERGETGAQGLPGIDGKDGQRGEQGASGIPGEKGERGERGAEGEEGQAGRDGRDGLAGLQGEKGLDGKDGINGKDGRDGIDGKDGFSAEHMTASLEGDRTIVLSYVRGTETKEFGRLVLPYQLYKGVFREGQNYVQGDTVTHGGSIWHCNEDTAEKPGLSKSWTLSVKAGRDGKDGKLIPVKPREPIKI